MAYRVELQYNDCGCCLNFGDGAKGLVTGTEHGGAKKGRGQVPNMELMINRTDPKDPPNEGEMLLRGQSLARVALTTPL